MSARAYLFCLRMNVECMARRKVCAESMHSMHRTRNTFLSYQNKKLHISMLYFIQAKPAKCTRKSWTLNIGKTWHFVSKLTLSNRQSVSNWVTWQVNGFSLHFHAAHISCWPDMVDRVEVTNIHVFHRFFGSSSARSIFILHGCGSCFLANF